MTLFQHSKIFKHNIDMCICTYHIEITFVCDSNHLRIRKCLFVGLMILYNLRSPHLYLMFWVTRDTKIVFNLENILPCFYKYQWQFTLEQYCFSFKRTLCSNVMQHESKSIMLYEKWVTSGLQYECLDERLGRIIVSLKIDKNIVMKNLIGWS